MCSATDCGGWLAAWRCWKFLSKQFLPERVSCRWFLPVKTDIYYNFVLIKVAFVGRCLLDDFSLECEFVGDFRLGLCLSWLDPRWLDPI